MQPIVSCPSGGALRIRSLLTAGEAGHVARGEGAEGSSGEPTARMCGHRSTEQRKGRPALSSAVWHRLNF